jgi:hypothetical protein
MKSVNSILLLFLLLPMRLNASEPAVPARITTVSIDPTAVTPLHLRAEFESAIHMPEEITSVILGSPGEFKAEHNEGEPEYVYVKPITREPAQSNLLIATKSGQHVTLELISDGGNSANSATPIDFLIEYQSTRSFLIGSDPVPGLSEATADSDHAASPRGADMAPDHVPSSLDTEYDQQTKINTPGWTKWDEHEVETSVGDIRQWNNQTVVAYSVLNPSDHPVEIMPPQIQISGRKHKKHKDGKDITSEQLQVREYRLSSSRLEPGARADGVVVFDRPNFKQSNERLFLQLAQADQVNVPILIRLPFTPPIAGGKQ